MKKNRLYILASSVLAIAAACTDINELNEYQGNEDLMIIEATIDVPGTQTKTYMGNLADSNYPVLWSNNDKIALLSEEGVSEFTIKSGAGTTKAEFGGNASQLVGTYPNTLVYPAVYPVEGAFADTFGGTVWVGTELPQIQTYMGGSDASKGFADNVYPMAASTLDPTEYHFFNMAGIIRLKIYQSTPAAGESGTRRISRITLKSNSHSPVSGPVAMAFNSETGEVIEGSGFNNGKTVKAYDADKDGKLEGSESVMIDLTTITPDPSKPLEKGIWLPSDNASALEFNIAVIPQTFPNGFTVEVMDDSNKGSTIWVSEDDITVNRSEILEMTAMDFIKPEPMGIANCFQMNEPGEYLLPAYAYGNRLDIKIGTSEEGFDLAKCDAAIFWTDIVDGSGNKIDAITDLKYLKFADGVNYMSFKLAEDPSTMATDSGTGEKIPGTGSSYRGNVVIALYTPENNQIWWTWHMWLTDTPQDVLIDGACAAGSYEGIYPDGSPLKYEADATDGKMLIMDRNLGAKYATPEQAIASGGQPWETYGLYYQDGRKDPFIGGCYNGNIGLSPNLPTAYDEVAKNGIHKFEDVPFGEGTHVTWTNPIFYNEISGELKDWVMYPKIQTLTSSIRNPQVYSFDKTGDNTVKKKATWQWTDCYSGDNQSWMTKSKYNTGTHGETGLTFGDHEAYWNRTKTIMDPCPPGYSVLGERGGYFFKGGGTKEWRTSETNGFGLMYTYNGTGIWWPAAGVRSCEGLMAGVGEYGYYFFYDHIDANHGGHGVMFQLGNNIDGKGNNGKFLTESSRDAVITNHATPVRCVKDKQGDYASGGGKKNAPKRISVIN